MTPTKESASASSREGRWSWMDLRVDEMDWSPSCWTMLGYEPEEFPASYSKWIELVHPEDRHWLIQTSFPHQDRCFVALHRAFDYRMRHKSGEYTWFRHNTIVHHDQTGKPVQMSGSTSRIDSPEGLGDPQRPTNAQLRQFAYICSHDLQAPLRKIQAFGEFLQQEYAPQLDGRGQDYVEFIVASATRMQALISDLLMFSQLSEMKHEFSEIDLNEIALAVVTDLELQVKDNDGCVRIEDMPRIDGNASLVRQILQNLVSNSLKFRRTDASPVVTVSARLTEAVGDEQQLCEICVQDNGIGFEQQYIDRIFAPFQRLHSHDEYPGSGIGLAVCRLAAGIHGGTITATSSQDKGSRFVVTLPRKQARVFDAGT